MFTTPVLPAALTILLGDLPGLMRLALSKALRTDAGVQIVGSTAGPDDLIAQTRRLRPDLIITSELPATGMKRLAQYHRGPVLLYAAQAPKSAVLREAAQWGVYDHIGPLPAATDVADYGFARRDLLRKVHQSRVVAASAVQRLSVSSGSAALGVPGHVLGSAPRGIVVVGGSTGGAAAVEQVVRGLQPGLRWTIIVAVHLPAAFTASLVERVRRASSLPVVEGRCGLRLQAGQVVVVPGGANWAVRGELGQPLWLQQAAEPAAVLDEPSIDLLMVSAARAAGPRSLGVVLTGLGKDGTAGAAAVRHFGGTVVAQNEQAAVFAMPKSVIQAGYASAVLPLPDIARFVNGHVQPLRPASTAARVSPVIRSYPR
ncbi:chemotaxis protein CheB [Hymenobacter gummosus]|uniref:protein-glutamate methylesterase n=1 Tax=Hymenobacter gummosus TaxID=1776032 RepID=A0A431U7C5_9BACT|nr:chemotaxis protein CheB [Hymenobacter gummosus]RTQ52340.1 chemotaxis protein CheB [Hymenobacter gummosus]